MVIQYVIAIVCMIIVLLLLGFMQTHLPSSFFGYVAYGIGSAAAGILTIRMGMSAFKIGIHAVRGPPLKVVEDKS